MCTDYHTRKVAIENAHTVDEHGLKALKKQHYFYLQINANLNMKSLETEFFFYSCCI